MLSFVRAKWLPIIIALVIASALLWGTMTRNALVQARKDVAALSEALSVSEAENGTLRKLRAADTSAVASRDKEVTVINTKEAKGRAETVKALEANPDWANQPIPRDVLDSLRP